MVKTSDRRVKSGRQKVEIEWCIMSEDVNPTAGRGLTRDRGEQILLHLAGPYSYLLTEPSLRTWRNDRHHCHLENH